MAHQANEKTVGERPCKAQVSECYVGNRYYQSTEDVCTFLLDLRHMALNMFTLNSNVIANIVNLMGFIAPWETSLWVGMNDLIGFTGVGRPTLDVDHTIPWSEVLDCKGES